MQSVTNVHVIFSFLIFALTRYESARIAETSIMLKRYTIDVEPMTRKVRTSRTLYQFDVSDVNAFVPQVSQIDGRHTVGLDWAY